jgi:hypothetical protein
MKTSIKKIMNRKKFFAFTGTGLFGFVLMKSLPFNLLEKSNKDFEHQVKVKINPSAVSRNK